LIRKALLAFSISFALAGWAEAQQGGGQGRQTPQPRQPTVPDSPSLSTPRLVTITGRIIGDRYGQVAQLTEVRLEGQGSEAIGFAYTDDLGEFTFRNVSITPGQICYVVVKVDGFKPVRQMLDTRTDLALGSRLTIFLEPEVTLKKAGNSRGETVDLRQLQAKIPAKAVDEYKKGLEESSKGNFNKAVERLERATKLAPDFYEAQNSLGLQYLRVLRFREAEAALEQARKLSPNAAEPLVNLGTVYYREGEKQSEAGNADESEGSFQKAADLLEEAIRRNPGSASAHYYLGAALYKTAVYDRAESMLHRALELDANMSEVQLLLVNVYTKQRRYNEALEQVTRYLDKNPKSPQRADLERIKGQLEKAVKP
jgi:Flp pilus assembly protein TadD